MTNMRDDIRKRIEAVRRGEAPEGYIHSHGYTIPSEWNVVPFGSVFKRSTRKNKSGCENVLTISAQHGLVSQRDYYDKDIASEDKSSYYLMKRGEYAYNKSYSSGYPFGAIKRLEKYEEGIVSPLYICFAPSPNTNTDFYSQYFEGGLYNREIYRFAQEGARNHGLLNIAVEDFFDGVLVAPPEPEQQRIAEILSACDRAIELKQKLVEELQQLKKICLAKMFPQSDDNVPEIRFPGFSERWEQRMLSAIYKTIRNAFVGTATPYYVPNGHFYLESNNVKDGQINTNTKVFINDEFYYQQKSKWLHTNDIVMVQSGHVGHAAVIPESFDNTAAHALIVFTHPICEIEPYFLNYQFQTAKSLKKISDIATGNTIKHILASDMQNFVVDIPSIGEQRQIAAIFQKLDSLITLHQRELEEVQQKKKALMQLLLTGLVRVNA